MKRITTETSEADSYQIQIEELKKDIDRELKRRVEKTAKGSTESGNRDGGNERVGEKSGSKASRTVKESGTNQEDAGESFLTTQSEADLKAADEKIKAAQKIKR